MNQRLLLAKSVAVLKITRPLNAFMSIISVLMAAFVVLGSAIFETDVWLKVSLAMLGVVCIGSAANALNDAYDVEIDRINRPNRPIPSGALTIQEATNLWWCGIALGFLSSLWLSWWHFGMVALSAVMVYFYNTQWKRSPFWGNLVVSFIVSLGILYGGWAVGTSPLLWILVAFAFVSTLAREICKDLEDIEGDAAVGSRTLPILMGTTWTQRLIASLIGILVCLLPIPYFLFVFSGFYLILMFVVGMLCLMSIWHIFQTEPTHKGAHITSRLLKAVMLFGMLAFLT